jgi:TorA maturation chaperone TorD
VSEHLYILTICLPLGTILLVFGMRYLAVVRQAKVKTDQDEAYRALAESTRAALADMQARLEGIEKILKDVE